MPRNPTSDSFLGRIDHEKQRLQAKIADTEPGPARDALERKLRQLDVAQHVNEWLSSPGLQSPR